MRAGSGRSSLAAAWCLPHNAGCTAGFVQLPRCAVARIRAHISVCADITLHRSCTGKCNVSMRLCRLASVHIYRRLYYRVQAVLFSASAEVWCRWSCGLRDRSLAVGPVSTRCEPLTEKLTFVNLSGFTEHRWRHHSTRRDALHCVGADLRHPACNRR